MQDRNEDGYIRPKTDIATENRPCQQEINLPTLDFRGYVSFREAKTLMEKVFFWGETRVKWVKKRGSGLMWRLLNQGRNQQIVKAQEDTLLLQVAQLQCQGFATIQTKHSLL